MSTTPSPTPFEIAESFSRHDFTATFPHLAEDIDWHNVGGDRHRGRQAVIDACNATTGALAHTRTTFTRFRTIPAGNTVVIDSQADYVDADGPSTVASCDIYDFTNGQLSTITSYAVELPTPEGGG